MYSYYASHVILKCNSLEASFLDHTGESLLIGELADALYKVLVRGSIIGYNAPNLRDDVQRVQVICLLQPGLFYMGEFQTKKPEVRGGMDGRLIEG